MSAAVSAEHQAELTEYVAEEVRALRARRNLTQADLARVLGIPQGQVSKREKGTVPFTLKEIWILAEFFETTPLALLGAGANRVPAGQLTHGHDGLVLTADTDR